MSISKKWATVENVARVLELYRSKEAPTALTIGEQLGASLHTVCWILREKMPQAEYKALGRLRYSRSKMGVKNPMLGKTGEQHHNWKGIVEDGHGYLTCLVGGKRVFVHRHVVAQALGLKSLPEVFDVHHINNDRKNNRLDNLALVTRAGHLAIHSYQRPDSVMLRSKKLSLWEAFQYTTSP